MGYGAYPGRGHPLLQTGISLWKYAERWIGVESGFLCEEEGVTPLEVVLDVPPPSGMLVTGKERSEQITVLDVWGNMASARLVTPGWTDHMTLSKVDGEWKILSVAQRIDDQPKSLHPTNIALRRDGCRGVGGQDPCPFGSLRSGKALSHKTRQERGALALHACYTFPP
jgi:hypothetical protein